MRVRTENCRIDADLKEKVENSVFFRMKNEHNPGLQPGQLRYDSLLKALVAVKMFSRAMASPPTEQYQKMNTICSETFNCTQDKVIGAIFAKTKQAKRSAILKDTMEQQGVGRAMRAQLTGLYVASLE